MFRTKVIFTDRKSAQDLEKLIDTWLNELPSGAIIHAYVPLNHAIVVTAKLPPSNAPEHDVIHAG